MHMTQTSLTQRRTEITGEMVLLQETSLIQRRTEITSEMVLLHEHVEKLQADLDKQKKLVSALITMIMEEADGVQSGAAPTIPNQPKRGYCM
ncbi:MAG TPA: hypothetical protein EYO22_01850 [Candidatus Poseidoniales archaeon]|nr:hypothetical protein [Candidatus Poseidoniales archaeon]HIB41922.1 hypothetical protein [Candidatus Poseidoniales archaeon]